MEIQDIKNQLSITELVAHYNLKTNTNHMLCCPWHNDKTPSLQIYLKTNTWTCFSSNCSAGSGDVIDFIMKYERISKYEALLKAKRLLGVETSKTKKRVDDKEVYTKFYQQSLKGIQRSKNGKAYAESRNLNYEKLQIGFSSYEMGKSWDDEIKKRAEELGLLKIKNCLIFPMKDKEGNVVSVYGRSIAYQSKVKHFYLKGGYKGLYPKYPTGEMKRLILTESIIDAAVLFEYLAIENECPELPQTEILALYGTNGWTKEHEQVVKEATKLEEVILFFDGDEAGIKAIEKYGELIKKIRPELIISKVETPLKEDVNSLIIGHDAMILESLLMNRKSIGTKQIKEEILQEEIDSPSTSGILNTDKVDLLRYETETLDISILGGIKITGLDRLKVTVKIVATNKKNSLPIRHSLDLYHVKQVEQLTQKISETFELRSNEVEKILSELTGELEKYREERIEEMKPKKKERIQLTAEEKRAALDYLKDKKLLRNTLTDIAKTGIVGEVNNSLIAYLAYTSRKREKPLHIMCLGASGMGKTYLQEKVSELIPDEEKIEITSLSDNALYYFGREALKQKLILIEDLDGAQNVLYPLRELQSKRRISKTVTLKDNKGKLNTVNLVVEGPVCVSGCTTKERIYEDNANRCILLYVDGSAAQDKRIMDYQKSISSGKVNKKEEARITCLLQNVQRLLQPIKIVNPYAEMIDLPREVFKPRRTLMLLLSFIETITFYHQYQRKVKVNEWTKEEYIESTPGDIESAFSLLKEVLFTKSDELAKTTRTFLERLKTEVKIGETFYTQEIRKQLRLSSSTVHRYIRDLQRNGYIKYVGGSKIKGYEYEILDYDEYKRLKDSVDEKLENILKRIPVSQSYPTSKNGINKELMVSDLT